MLSKVFSSARILALADIYIGFGMILEHRALMRAGMER